MQIARETGWEPGVRSDKVIYPCARPLALLDIDWHRPNWERHMETAMRERPWLAAVPDLMSEAQLPEALQQAEALAPYCERVLLIPKAFEVIERIPERIGGAAVVLGYSVPTRYGGTCVPLWEFGRRPVHLLGGSPLRQRELCSYLNVVSADGNMAHKLAMRGVYYRPDGRSSGNTVVRADGRRWAGNVPLEALRRSLESLRCFWGAEKGEVRRA